MKMNFGYPYFKKNNIDISMKEENHSYENALVEHITGILKDEFNLDQVYTKKNTSINLYNEIKSHF
jgi:putative transposase